MVSAESVLQLQDPEPPAPSNRLKSPKLSKAQKPRIRKMSRMDTGQGDESRKSKLILCFLCSYVQRWPSGALLGLMHFWGTKDFGFGLGAGGMQYFVHNAWVFGFRRSSGCVEWKFKTFGAGPPETGLRAAGPFGWVALPVLQRGYRMGRNTATGTCISA